MVELLIPKTLPQMRCKKCQGMLFRILIQPTQNLGYVKHLLCETCKQTFTISATGFVEADGKLEMKK